MSITQISICFTIAFSFISAFTVHAQNGSIDKILAVKSDSTGWLVFNTEVDSFYLVIDEDFKNAMEYASGESIRVKAGKHKVRLVKKYYRDMVTNIEMKPDTNMVINTNLLPFRNFNNFKYYSSYPRIYWGAPIIVKSDPDARLYVDDKLIGEGIGRIDTSGIFTVKSVLPSGKSTKKTFYRGIATHQSFQVNELYNRPAKLKTLLLGSLPGASQLYQGKKLKGFALLGGALIGAGLAVKFQINYNNSYRTYDYTKERYNDAVDPSTAFKLGNLADKQFNKVKKFANLRNGLIYGLAGIYIYNVIDAFLKPKTGYRNTLKIDPYLEFNQLYKNQIALKASYSF